MKADRMGNYMKIQPWQTDKRSWIFYLDQIENDQNIVWGETKESIFLLDCETARLSIWSKKWQTFTDIGISNLLKRMSKTWHGSDKENLRGTYIFYKGIELQSKYLANDTELLEFIDIKGGLEKSYININRNGFTEAGELFFKEQLYPALMEKIQEVLNELEREPEQTKQGINQKFDEKIINTVERLCDASIDVKSKQLDVIRNKEALISLVGSVAVLAYLAMRDEWNVWEGLGGRHSGNGTWEALVKEIDKRLSDRKYGKLQEQLGTMTALFGIKVYGEKYEVDSGSEISTSFLKIFSTDNHWAILQCRMNDYSPWVSHLIKLEEKTYIFSLLTDISKGEETEDKLEEWGKRMCDIVHGERYEEFFTMQDSQQQMLLEWMLKNIPTIGLFCNEQGNVRLNVLAGRIYPSIYMNKNFKCLIMERMIEKAWEDDIRRFSTIAWRGREYISCDELPFSVYFIKRGYLPVYSYHKCIVPIEGQILKAWGQALKEIEKLEFVHQIDLLSQDINIEFYFDEILNDEQSDENMEIQDFLKTSSTDTKWELCSEVWDRMMKRIYERSFEVEIPFRELLINEKERREKWKRICLAAARILVMDLEGKMDRDMIGSLEKTIQEGDGLDTLCDAWLYCCIYQEKVVSERSELRRIYEDYVGSHKESQKKNENIVRYIEDRKGREFNIEALKAATEEYKRELIELAQELEVRQMLRYLRDNMKWQRLFTDKLKSAYLKYKEEHSEQ